MDFFVDRCHANAPVDPDRPVRLRGKQASRNIAEATAKGVLVSFETAMALRTWAERLGPLSRACSPSSATIRSRISAPVTTVAFSPHALVVHPSVPANTVPELVAYAKSKPDGLNFANPGVGTLIQLAAEQFKTLNGIKLHASALQGRRAGGAGPEALRSSSGTCPRSMRPRCRGSSRARGRAFLRQPARPKTSSPS